MDRNLDCILDHTLYREPEDVPIYKGHSLLNTTKRITLSFIVQSLLHHNPPNIWIKIIKIATKIECLLGTTFFNPDCDLDNFAACNRGMRYTPCFLQLLGCV